jgi:uncharacterized secreted protein with C-terminal beta-propeller domain
MKIKKSLVSLLIGALLFDVLGLQIGASAQISDSFSDVGEWNTFYKAIDSLRADGVVVGYGDGTYGIDENINRAEFLKIVMEVSDYEVSGEDCFSDVTDQWFAPYVCTAKEKGFVDGYADGTFKPEKEINFAEASKMITNILGIDLAQDDETWFSPYVIALETTDSIPAAIDSFDKYITRGEMAEMIWRIDTGTTYKVANTYENISDGVAVSEYGGELMTFESCTELHDYFRDNSYEQYYYDDFAWEGDVITEERANDESEKSIATPSASSDAGLGQEESASDYSSTNVQVEGVDEADIIKNDGKYIYLIKGDTVRVVDAYPPSKMNELDEITFGDSSFYPREMYLDGDRLVVIGDSYASLYNDYDASDVVYTLDEWGSYSKVYVLDVSVPSDVEVLRSLSFEGYYNTSRKVGDTVYLVSNQYNYYWPWKGDEWNEGDLVPVYGDSATGEVDKLVSCSDVKYMPGVSDVTNYTVVVAIPVDDADEAVSEEVIIGSSGNIYSSPDNLYVAEPKYNWSYWYDESGDTEETYVHRFALDGANIEYNGVGAVPGTTLNQFSMDEDGDYFRIATTVGGWWSSNGPSNGVYVLDKDLNLVGSVSGLAEGEEIYSVRFMGDRVYMVTFEQMDPLFVIDLSNPNNPSVLGELHIPGVSDYLHPFDENHLIGFGLDSLSEDEILELGWSWFQGMKISMFDVTDVENPVELHKVVIGDRGTTSPLLYNHKALLFDADKGLLSFPVLVAEIPQAVKDDLDLDAWVYGTYTFQGAYVYDVSVEDGFDLRGTISHYDEDELGENFDYYYYYGDLKGIDRILYIGDYFYTISQEMVKSNEMESLEESGEVVLAD